MANGEWRMAHDFRGYTLIELLLVIGIAAILLSLSTINLIKAQKNVDLSATKDALVADMKSQQIKAMNGTAVNVSGSDSYGVYFHANTYVLFHGTTYNPSDTTNFTVTFDGPIGVTTTFPGDTVVFSQMTGEVSGYSDLTDTITLTNTPGGDQKVIELNRYGVVVSE